MLKTLDIMQEEEPPITRCQSTHSALESYAVNNALLRPITSAKTAPEMFHWAVRHHLIE